MSERRKHEYERRCWMLPQCMCTEHCAESLHCVARARERSRRIGCCPVSCGPGIAMSRPREPRATRLRTVASRSTAVAVSLSGDVVPVARAREEIERV